MPPNASTNRAALAVEVVRRCSSSKASHCCCVPDGHELHGEHPAERGVVPAPAEAHQLHLHASLFVLLNRRGPDPASLHEGAEEDQAPDSVGMSRRVGDGDRSTLGDAQEDESVEVRGVDHGLQIGHPGFEGEVLDVPVGESATPFVVTDQPVAAGQLPPPVPPDRALPVVVEMVEPVGRLDQRRSGTDRGIGEAYTTLANAQSDPLLRVLLALSPAVPPRLLAPAPRRPRRSGSRGRGTSG